jgi:hypothetical protein
MFLVDSINKSTMRKYLILLIALVVITEAAEAQLWKLRRYEVVASLGTTQFYGDIGGFSKGDNLLGLKDFSFKQTRFNFTTSIKYRIIDVASVRLNLAWGGFHATDAKGSNESRGYEVTTAFFEPTLMGEYYFIKNKNENSFLHLKDSRKGFTALIPAIDIYTFAGFGGLSYKVTPNSMLAPKVTDSKGFTPVIPFGVGINLFYSTNISLGMELGARFTFSDNIDGYSSVYSKSNDVYHFLNFTLTYKINTGVNGLPKFK